MGQSNFVYIITGIALTFGLLAALFLDYFWENLKDFIPW
jgi:hypothetical protein